MKSISITNYKAFSTGELDIKPLTIILGANSSGKSSLLQLFLMLEQTLNSNDNDDFLKLSGHYVNLGESENIFKDRSFNKTLELKFEINYSEFMQNVRMELEPLKDLSQLYSFLSSYSNGKTSTENNDSIQLVSENPWKFSKKTIQNSRMLESFILKLNKAEGYESRIKKIRSSLALFEELKNYVPKRKKLYVKFQFRLQSNKLLLESHSIIIDDKVLVNYSPQKQPCFGSEMFTLSLFKQHLDYSNEPNLDYDGLKIKNNIDDNILYKLFVVCEKQICRFFESDRIDYIGPLRAYPQRYYFLDGSDGYTVKSGEGLANILKKHTLVKTKVNQWLNKFGLSIDISVFKDIIHNIKVSQNNIKLDLTDVGFGLSQVLPILVQGFLTKPNSTTIIEQPEIHLHPKMQAELVDLFLDILNLSKDNKKYRKRFIIETHSEYFLKRLRRRIAEGTISSADVAIYFIEGRSEESDSAKIKRVKVDSDGSIDWPKDFYITEMDDDLAFLKLKMKRS